MYNNSNSKNNRNNNDIINVDLGNGVKAKIKTKDLKEFKKAKI